MRIVFASAAGGWQRRVLDIQGAVHRLESFYYAKEKQFDVMFQEIAERMDNEDKAVDMLARFLKGDSSMMQCTVCGKQAGTCNCWTKCTTSGCTWSYRTGKERCPNCFPKRAKR